VEETVVNDVACTICGCVCDDLEVTLREDRVASVRGACPLSHDWFLAQRSQTPSVTAIQGREYPAEQAIQRSAEILRRANAPLVYGLSRSSTEGQQEAGLLAEALGATIDTTASLCHAPSIIAIQHVGESTCSLGEIRNRADLVVFWGVDPTKSHPRHMERYSVDPKGMFLPHGRADRTVMVVDTKPTATADQADIFVQVHPHRDFEVLWALRSLLAGIPLPATSVAGVTRGELIDLADRLRNCRCGVFFFGLGLARQGLGHLTVEALLRLTRDLNSYTRFHARRMRMQGDVTGADTVLCWQTGYPFSVNLNRGYPRYSPGEYTANEVLERGEVDACVIVGSETIPFMSSRARDHLARIPSVLLEYPECRRHFRRR
jgi:formylmethanofuran dehydrogenase subunit B